MFASVYSLRKKLNGRSLTSALWNFSLHFVWTIIQHLSNSCYSISCCASSKRILNYWMVQKREVKIVKEQRNDSFNMSPLICPSQRQQNSLAAGMFFQKSEAECFIQNYSWNHKGEKARFIQNHNFYVNIWSTESVFR